MKEIRIIKSRDIILPKMSTLNTVAKNILHVAEISVPG